MAEALDVPCVALSPYHMPSTCPPDFKRRFAAAYGQKLLNRLVDAGGIPCSSRGVEG